MKKFVFASLFLILVLAINVSAVTDWKVYGYDADRSSWDGVVYPDLISLNNQIAYDYAPLNANVYAGSSSVSDGLLYWMSDEVVNVVNASDISQNQTHYFRIWTIPDSDNQYSRPIISGDSMYIGACGGGLFDSEGLYRFNRTSLALIQKYTTPSYCLFGKGQTEPIIDNGYLYIRDIDYVYQFNATNITAPINTFLIDFSGSNLVSDGQSIFVGASDMLYELDADNISVVLNNYSGLYFNEVINSYPIIKNGFLYLGKYQFDPNDISSLYSSYNLPEPNLISVPMATLVNSDYYYISSRDFNTNEYTFLQLNASDISQLINSYEGSVSDLIMVGDRIFALDNNYPDYIVEFDANNISNIVNMRYVGALSTILTASNHISRGDEYLYISTLNSMLQIEWANISQSNLNVVLNNGTAQDNSYINSNNIYIDTSISSIFGSVNVRNATINLYNSSNFLVYNASIHINDTNGTSQIDLITNITGVPNGVHKFNIVAYDTLGIPSGSELRTVTIVDCFENWVQYNTSCNGFFYTLLYNDTNSCGTNYFLPINNGSVISCGCSESWSVQYTACINNSRIRYYTDANSCGTYINLPVNNNTVVSCGCVESWSPYFTACNNGFRFKYYVDSNSCNTYLNLPVDNGGQFACNVTVNNINNVYVNGSASYFGYYRIGVDVNASTTIFVNLTYPNGSITTFNTTLIGDDYFTDLIYGVPNGTYTMTAINGSESYSKSFIISDNQSIVPSSYLSVVPAGQNFSFNLSIYSNVALNYSAVCSVPSGFECIIPANISTDGFNSTPIIIVSNVSLSEGSYSGSINITRLIDNRVVTIPLTLGISNVFGIPEIQNISNFLSVIYDTGTSSKSYIVKNVGSYPLSMCNVVFDGDLANKGFISKSPTNFNLSVNDSVSFTITYTTPQTGTYQGYLDVICTATADNQSNGLVSRPFHQIIVNTFTQSAGSGGGGGGGSQGAVVVSAGNRSLFVIESDSGATFTAKYIYPSQSRTQTFIIRSLIAEDQALTISCSGNFCPNVKFSRDSILLRGFSQEFITATITAPTNVDYDVTFFYSVVVSDSFQHSGEVSNQVIVSKIAYWYSKFNPVTSPEEASYWTSLGGTDLPKILLYFLLVLIADVLVFVIYPDGKSRSENLLLVLLVTSVIVFIGASFIY